MNLENANKLSKTIEEDNFLQNLKAQAKAKHILLNVNEPIQNYPKFTNYLEERLSSLAFTHLSIGCTLFENQLHFDSYEHFEKAGEIINNIFTHQIELTNSKYYLLISSLALYIATQYSKSYLVVKEIEYSSPITILISQFLKKDFANLPTSLDDILLNNEYSDNSISEIANDKDANASIYSVLLARTIACILEYFHEGDYEWISRAKQILVDLKELSQFDDEPSIWWLARLLRILIDNVIEYSYWENLTPIFPNNSKELKLFINSLYFKKIPNTELFYSQQKSLSKIQNKNGCVICLPTSSGKTRIAEILILDTILNNNEAKVLYLAPFRSLAFELEEEFTNKFKTLDLSVTHLYGSGQFNRFDKSLINDSDLIIATPEKAKAIIRADETILENIKLIVVDEGHLLGTQFRYIQNEMFLEELKHYMSINDGKFLLLSAVLPNAKIISKWLTGSEDNAYTSNWRPSTHRFGLLKWNGMNVNLEWFGDEKAFNRNFIKPFKPPRARKLFPSNKKQAVALASQKLLSNGSVLIFVARSNMVLSQAREIACIYKHSPNETNWDDGSIWQQFKLACLEAFGEDSEIFLLARQGIFCHNGNLPNDVRISMEQLMRLDKSKIIVATSTLGQGVNIGISSVIFANVWLDGKSKIENKDFWNIAGRAGRAFADFEGKVLFAVDETNSSWQIKRDMRMISEYLSPDKMEKAKSGLLELIKHIISIANACNVNFELLLQLIAENDFERLKINDDIDHAYIESLFDLIDDSILSINYKFAETNFEINSDWIDDCFRDSLAYLQAIEEDNFNPEDVIDFLKARNEGIIKMVGGFDKWKSLLRSSIPLASSIYIENNIQQIINSINNYNSSQKDEVDLITIFKELEDFVKNLPSYNFKNSFSEENVNEVRQKWVTGNTYFDLDSKIKADRIISQYFAFILPWAFNAIARKLQDLAYEAEAEFIEELALVSELGLPNLFSIKIYLSGIRSRTAAKELSNILNEELSSIGSSKLAKLLVDNLELLKKHASDYTFQWIELLSTDDSVNFTKVKGIKNFTISAKTKFESEVLNVREYNENIYLCSPDYSEYTSVRSTKKLPFSEISNNTGIYFKKNRETNSYEMKLRNSNLKIE